jgi:hypothetical protein
LTNVENPIVHEDFSPLEGNVPQEFLDRFRDPTRLSRYLNMIKERQGLTIDAMAKGAYTSKDTVKNLLGKTKNPRMDTAAPVIYSSGGSFDEMFYPEGYEARIESATKTVKEMGEAQLAAQKESYESEIASIKETNEKAMAEIIETHKQEILSLTEAHKQEILEINIRHKQEVADLGIYHQEKAEAERKSNEKILDIAVFDKRWFRLLSCILASTICVLLIMLALVTSKLVNVMSVM